LLLAGGFTAADCRDVSRRGAAVHVTVPMSGSFIGNGASAACGFQVSATDSGQGPVRGLLGRQRHGRADACPRKHQASSLSREMSPMCRLHGIPEPFGNAWTAKVRRRDAISATEGTDRG
jgi:hypothetical protein